MARPARKSSTRTRPGRPPGTRKRRTRGHVIAEMSANHVEWHALQCGFAVERVQHDYGIDLILSTYAADGQFQNGFVYIQLKATDSLRRLKGGALSFRVERADLEWWLNEELPVILVVYDAKRDGAYWLYVQAYFESQTGFALSKITGEVAVRIPAHNVVDPAAVLRFASYRDDVKRQQAGRVRHHA